MKPISQKYFEKLLKSADEVIISNSDYITLIKNGNERKLPISLWNQYQDNLTAKIIRNKEKNFFHYY